MQKAAPPGVCQAHQRVLDRGRLLQRCACGSRSGPTGACADCRKKRLQPRLRIGAPGDRYEHEADRAADAAMGTDPVPRLSRVASSAQTMQRAPCCCCAESIDLTGGDLYRGNDRVGHRFQVPISLRYGAGEGTASGSSDCTMEWRERTSKTAPLLAETGKWIDVFPVARQYLLEHPNDQIPAVAAWDKRPRTCGAAESLTLNDAPFVDAKQSPNSIRTLDFDLVIKSGAGCPCAHAERHVYARQQLHLINGVPFLSGVSFTKLDAEPSWPPETEAPAATPSLLNRKADGAGMTGAYAPESVHDVLATSGQALDASARRTMERRFGYGFGQVRVHTDHHAAASAADVQARAYTVGQHVVFGAGTYTPSTSDGTWLLAHELAHVVQQSGGMAPRTPPGAEASGCAGSSGPSFKSLKPAVSAAGTENSFA